MSAFDFNTGAPQIAPPPAAYPSQTLGAQTDPRSQYLAAALQALGRQPQASSGGLAANLAAETLLQYSARNPTWTPGLADGPAGPSNSGGGYAGGLYGLGLGVLGGGSPNQ